MKCPTCINETWDSPCPQCGHFLVPCLADIQNPISHAQMVEMVMRQPEASHTLQPTADYIRQLEAEIALLRREPRTECDVCKGRRYTSRQKTLANDVVGCKGVTLVEATVLDTCKQCNGYGYIRGLK